MVQQELLELIWRGAILPAQGASDLRLLRMFRALVPVQATILSASRGIDRVAVLLDDTDLMPELSLGDVLAEELSIDVPYGSLVILREAQGDRVETQNSDLSYELGLVVGEAMLEVIRSGLLPMSAETGALYAMACSFDRLIEGSAFHHLGAEPARFREGLAGVLGAYWAGVRDARSEVSRLFDRADFLRRPELLNYLRLLDGNFQAARLGAVSSTLMHYPGGCRPFQEWLSAVLTALEPVIEATHIEAAPRLRRAI